MRLNEILVDLRQGKKARRKPWRVWHAFLQLNDDNIEYVEKPNPREHYLNLWNPTTHDLVADDWEVIEGN